MDFRGFIFLKRKDKKLNLKNNVYAKNFKKNLFKKKNDLPNIVKLESLS